MDFASPLINQSTIKTCTNNNEYKVHSTLASGERAQHGMLKNVKPLIPPTTQLKHTNSMSVCQSYTCHANNPIPGQIPCKQLTTSFKQLNINIMIL
jgi:hypothetical protein